MPNDKNPPNEPSLSQPFHQPTRQESKRFGRKTIIAGILVVIALMSAGAVYAAFVLGGTVTATVGATDAQITYIGLWDDTTHTWISPSTDTQSFSCTTGDNGYTWACSVPGVLNPGDSYIVSFIVHNKGAVTIPSITASVSVSFDPTGCTTTTYAATTQGPWPYSTTNLASGSDWHQNTGAFVIGDHAICGGPLTITITVNG